MTRSTNTKKGTAIRSRISTTLWPWHKYILKNVRQWLEKRWFRGEGDGWCTDTTILLAQIMGKDHFRLFQGCVLGLKAPSGSGHVYGLLDDYWIIDLTLDGFRTSSGERGPKIVALPEWAPFVHRTYRYSEAASDKLNVEVRSRQKFIPWHGDEYLLIRLFCDLNRAMWRNSQLNSLTYDAQDKTKLRASRWSLRGFKAMLLGKREHMKDQVLRAFRKAVHLDSAAVLPTRLFPSFPSILSRN